MPASIALTTRGLVTRAISRASSNMRFAPASPTLSATALRSVLMTTGTHSTVCFASQTSLMPPSPRRPQTS